MAVGNRFMDPDTQAAIEAQSGGTPDASQNEGAEPKEAAAQQEPAAESANEPASNEDVNKQGEGQQQAQNEPAADDLNMGDIDLDDPDAVDKAVEKAGFSQEDLGKELAENDGKLTPETVKALSDVFGEDVVAKSVSELESQYAQAKEDAIKEASAPVEEMNNFIYSELAGGDIEKGKENVKILSDWAQKNIPKDQLDVINAKIGSGNKVVVKEGLQMAVTLWRKGQEKPMMTGDAAAANGGEKTPEFQPLRKDEFIKIMQTPKYKEDPEYAKQIDARRRKTIEKGDFNTPEFNATYRPVIR